MSLNMCGVVVNKTFATSQVLEDCWKVFLPTDKLWLSMRTCWLPSTQFTYLPMAPSSISCASRYQIIRPVEKRSHKRASVINYTEGKEKHRIRTPLLILLFLINPRRNRGRDEPQVLTSHALPNSSVSRTANCHYKCISQFTVTLFHLLI
jgi:hypothetical protein